MSTTLLEPAGEVRQRQGDRSAPGPGLRIVWASIVLALVATGLIFCHGCHAGDHDDELLLHILDDDR